MNKLLSIAIVAMFWIAVRPDGAHFCASGQKFRAAADTVKNIEAAQVATDEFCKVVVENPM